MLPRQVRRIGEVERVVIHHERYMEIGPIWDMIANDIVRHERFRDIPGIFPANVQEPSMLMLEIDVQQEEDFAILLQENKESKYRTCTI